MKRVVLTRYETGPEGTFGYISVDQQGWWTVERPWLDNASNISCIPEGDYPCRVTISPRFRRPLYLIDSVPKRFGVRIHPANLARQLNGCIALGKKLGAIDGVKAILMSRPAVSEFEAALGRRPFTLEIRNVWRNH